MGKKYVESAKLIDRATLYTPEEALDLYERNWRHADIKNMSEKEKEFITTLLNAFGREKLFLSVSTFPLPHTQGNSCSCSIAIILSMRIRG